MRLLFLLVLSVSQLLIFGMLTVSFSLVVFRPIRDADKLVVSFRYRRPDQPGKVYLFKTAASPPSAPPSSSSGAERGPTAQFFLGEKGGEIMSADVDLEPLERSGGPNFFEPEDFFQVSGRAGGGMARCGPAHAGYP